MTAVIFLIVASWWGSAIHVLFTPNDRFQLIGKRKGLWAVLTIIGCIPACWFYLLSVRPQLKATKDEQPPMKSLL